MGSNKTKQFFIFSLFMLLAASQGFAATGQELFNCTFKDGTSVAESVSGCGAKDFYDSNFPHARLVASGGHDGGRYLSYNYPNAGYEVGDYFNIPVNRKEITLVYWEKYDVGDRVSNNWNCKGTRAYTNADGGGAFIGAIMSRWGAASWQQGVFYSANMTTTSAVTSVIGGSSYCTATGTNTYKCGGDGVYGAAAVNWAGFGTAWHKIRAYYKMPTTKTSNDGLTTVWIDEKPLYYLTGIGGPPPNYTTVPWTDYITHVRVHPSDDFFEQANDKVAFNHGYDDIVIYEGYVPPGTTITPPKKPSAPSSFSVK